MSRKATGMAITASLLFAGVIIGAGLVLGTQVLTGASTQKTTTFTVTTTVFTSSTGNGQVAYAQVTTSIVSCNASTKECQIQLLNTGNAAVTPNGCAFSGSAGGPATLGSTPGSGGIPSGTPGTLTSGNSETVYCGQFPGTVMPGDEAAGSITLNDGGLAIFSGTWQ